MSKCCIIKYEQAQKFRNFPLSLIEVISETDFASSVAVITNVRRVRRGGGALGASAPPPHLGEKFRLEMFKRGEEVPHVPLRYDKIKTKKIGQKEDISKRKG